MYATVVFMPGSIYSIEPPLMVVLEVDRNSFGCLIRVRKPYQPPSALTSTADLWTGRIELDVATWQATFPLLSPSQALSRTWLSAAPASVVVAA